MQLLTRLGDSLADAIAARQPVAPRRQQVVIDSWVAEYPFMATERGLEEIETKLTKLFGKTEFDIILSEFNAKSISSIPKRLRHEFRTIAGKMFGSRTFPSEHFRRK